MSLANYLANHHSCSWPGIEVQLDSRCWILDSRFFLLRVSSIEHPVSRFTSPGSYSMVVIAAVEPTLKSVIVPSVTPDSTSTSLTCPVIFTISQLPFVLTLIFSVFIIADRIENTRCRCKGELHISYCIEGLNGAMLKMRKRGIKC